MKNNQNANVPDFAKSKPPQAPSWLGHCPYKVNKWGVWHHLHKHHDAYLIDFYRSPISNKMRIKRQWVHATEEEIYRAGYKQAIDLVDGWEWMGAKVYAQLHNFKVCDAKLQGNLETSSTLYDYSVSRAGRDFINSFKSKLSGMDVKKLSGLAVIGAGIVIGMFILLS